MIPVTSCRVFAVSWLREVEQPPRDRGSVRLRTESSRRTAATAASSRPAVLSSSAKAAIPGLRLARPLDGGWVVDFVSDAGGWRMTLARRSDRTSCRLRS